MTTYGNKYIFNFISQNGDEVEVCIQKKNYSGSFIRRPVGRGPVLKRERNGAILGTSLELYAECHIDQEYVELYTSSADEFRVLVYKNRELQWTGFVSPELYAEPDIAPPYDVQIIATDGLGELRNTLFDRPDESYPLGDHIDYILRKTGLSLSVDLISSLSWDDEAHNNSPSSLLDLTVNLTHLASNSDYDVLQDILTSFNACITQQAGRWMIVRKTDIYNNIPLFRTAAFGSVNKTTWWPIGSLSADIVPAKRKLTLTHENNYKDSILPGLISGVSGGWEFATGVYYNDLEKAYILSDEDYIIYAMEFPVYPISVPLRLSINARPLFNSSEEDRAVLGYFVELEGTVNGVRGTYYLVHSYDDALGRAVWQWYPERIPLMHTWWREELPEDVEQEVTTVNAVLPLGDNVRPDRIRIVVQNYPIISRYAIAVYDIALAQNDQIRGLKLIAEVGNNARESVETSVAISSSADPMLAETMYGVLRLDGGITSWHTPYNAASDLLKFLAADYAMLTALPAIRYRGTLNVPSQVTPWIPFIFERDNTYYLLETYSYDLLLDELEVELVSIPNSRVSIESETIIEIPAGGLSGSGTVSGGSGSSSGGGSGEGDNEGSTLIVDSEMDDESENAVQNKVIKAYVDGKAKDAQAAAEQYIQNEVLTYYATTKYVGEREEYLVGYAEGLVNDLEDDINGRGYLTSSALNGYATQEEISKTFATIAALNLVDGRLTAIEDYFSSEEDADTLINKWNEIVAFLNATEGTTLDNILSSKADKSDIPTKVGQLENDKGYITEHQDISGLATKKELNDGLNSKQNVISDLDTIRAGAALGATALQAVPDNYVTEKELTDKGYITAAAIANKVDKEDGKGLSSNDYTDAEKSKLASIADGAEVNVQADWNATSGDAFIKNKPSLHKVATSGSYNDLANKPTIPAAVTESTVEGWGFTKNTGTYIKPSAGIPKSDLASDVQTSLEKADSALQEHQSLAGYATEAWVNQQGFLKSASLNGYAKTTDLGDLAFLDAITSEMVTDALGFTPFDSAAFTKASIKNALGIADWALAANKPSYDDVYLKLAGGTINGNLTINGQFTAQTSLASVSLLSSSFIVNASLKVQPGEYLYLNGEAIMKWSDLKSKIACSFSEISSKPTTLDGYGITDAVRYEHSITPTASPNVMGYAGGSEGWPVGGPVMVWGTGSYFARLCVDIWETNPTMMISCLAGDAATEWATFVTSLNVEKYAMKVDSGILSGANLNELMTPGAYNTWWSASNNPSSYETTILVIASKTNYLTSQLLTDGQGHLFSRMSEGGTWKPWRTIIDADNLSEYALPKTGGSVDGILTVNGDLVLGLEKTLMGVTPQGGSLPQFRMFATAAGMYFQAATYDGTSTTGSIYFSGMYGTQAAEVQFNAANAIFTGGITLNGETINSWDNVRHRWSYQIIAIWGADINVKRYEHVGIGVTLTASSSPVTFNIENVAPVSSIVVFRTGDTLPTVKFKFGGTEGAIKWEDGIDITQNLSVNTGYRIEFDGNFAMVRKFK